MRKRRVGKQSCITQQRAPAGARGRQVRPVPGSGKGETVAANGRSESVSTSLVLYIYTISIPLRSRSTRILNTTKLTSTRITTSQLTPRVRHLMENLTLGSRHITLKFVRHISQHNKRTSTLRSALHSSIVVSFLE